MIWTGTCSHTHTRARVHACTRVRARAHACIHARAQEDYKRLEAAGIKTSEDLLELELEDITAIAQHLSLSTKKRLTRFAQLSPEVYYIHIYTYKHTCTNKERVHARKDRTQPDS